MKRKFLDISFLSRSAPKVDWGLWGAETHRPSKFHLNLVGSLSVVLLTNQPTRRTHTERWKHNRCGRGASPPAVHQKSCYCDVTAVLLMCTSVLQYCHPHITCYVFFFLTFQTFSGFSVWRVWVSGQHCVFTVGCVRLQTCFSRICSEANRYLCTTLPLVYLWMVLSQMHLRTCWPHLLNVLPHLLVSNCR